MQVKDFDDYAYKREHPETRGFLHKPTRKRLPWLYFLTGNASVRRSDLMRVGCFDESFTGYGHEDLELGYRLERAGVTDSLRAECGQLSLSGRAARRSEGEDELAGRSTVRFYRKHPDFAVQLNLGMTPISLGLHSVLERTPGLLAFFDARSAAFKVCARPRATVLLCLRRQGRPSTS